MIMQEHQLSISTITEIVETNLNTNLDILQDVYTNSSVINYDDPIEGITKLAFHKESKGLCKKDTLRKKERVYRNFQNQLSAYVRHLMKKTMLINKTGKRIAIEYAKTTTQIYEIEICLSEMYTGNIKLYIDKQLVNDINVENQNRIIICAGKVLRVKRDITFEFEAEITIDHINFKYPHEVSIFLFASGRCKLSGVKKLEDTPKSLNILWNGLSEPGTHFKVAELEIISRSTSLINTDFTAGFSLVRETLFSHMMTDYELEIHYDPDVHPAIQTRYYFNSMYDGKGRCLCNTRSDSTMTCKGKGSGNGIGQCKIVTNLIFQSGKVIITGGRALEHVEKSFKLISEILNRYKDDITRQDVIK
tara:strand:- start:82 stop:1167 length:1086 start_codon:yes stop_codon:yes gene_type:complete